MENRRFHESIFYITVEFHNVDFDIPSTLMQSSIEQRKFQTERRIIVETQKWLMLHEFPWLMLHEMPEPMFVCISLKDVLSSRFPVRSWTRMHTHKLLFVLGAHFRTFTECIECNGIEELSTSDKKNNAEFNSCIPPQSQAHWDTYTHSECDELFTAPLNNIHTHIPWKRERKREHRTESKNLKTDEDQYSRKRIFSDHRHTNTISLRNFVRGIFHEKMRMNGEGTREVGDRRGEWYV